MVSLPRYSAPVRCALAAQKPISTAANDLCQRVFHYCIDRRQIRALSVYAAFFFLSLVRAAFTRSESSSLAFSSFALRDELRFLPARFMKKVNILIPDAGPFGETLFDASDRAIVSGSLVKSPDCGCVESVVTPADHFRPVALCDLVRAALCDFVFEALDLRDFVVEALDAMLGSPQFATAAACTARGCARAPPPLSVF